MAENPYAKYANPYAGMVPIGVPDPKKPLELDRLRTDVAKGPDELRSAHAASIKADIEARKAQEDWAAAHPHIDPNAVRLTGEAYLKSLPPATAATVKALTVGRMQFPSGPALKAPYWQQMLGSVAQYDPDFDAVNYNARAHTRSDFTSGKSAANIKALNTAIGHLGHLASQIDGTASHGGFPGATTVNAIQNALSRSSGSSGPTNYDQTATALAGELTAVYRGSGGAEADIKRYIDQLSTNASKEQKVGAVQNIVGLLNSRLDALNDQYRKGMGTTAEPLQVLDPKAQKIVAQYGGIEGGPTPPPSGGDGPAPIVPATGNMQTDAEKSAYLDAAIRNGVPYAVATRNLGGAPEGGSAAGEKSHYDALVAFAKTPAGRKWRGSLADIQKPTTLAERVINSGPGIGVTNALNTAAGGLPVALQGEQAHLGLEAGNAAHPNYAGAGKVAGFLGGSLGLTKALGALGMARGAGLAANLAEGASNGAAENPENPVMGGLGGTAMAAAGEGAGHFLLAPALRGIAKTTPVTKALDFLSKARGGDGFAPVAPLSPGDSMVAKVTGRPDFGDVTARLEDAQRLGLPYAPADAHPFLRNLAGSAARKNPEVRAMAEDVLAPRQLGQSDRALSLIDRHLAPTGDIQNIVAGAKQQAQAVSKPLYEKAMQQPPVNDPQLFEALNTPAGSKAARQGYDIALNKGQSPGELSMSIDPTTGQPSYDSSINWPTLQSIKIGLNGAVKDGPKDAFGKLDMGHPVNQGMEALRKSYTARLGQLNPDYAAADAAYANVRGQGTAAQQGYGATTPRMTPDQTGATMAGLKPEYLPNFQQGYASNMADRIEATNLSRNPYELVNGSPAQKAKLATVFPQGAPQFETAHGMETDMTKTAREVIGGSPTTARQEADQQFGGDGFAGPALDIGMGIATGNPGAAVLSHALRNKAFDIARLGLGKKAAEKAAQVGPILLNTNPGESLATLNSLMQQKAARDAYVKQFGQAGGAMGAAFGAPLFSFSQGQ